MATLAPKAFDRTITLSVDGTACPTCGATATCAEVTAGFLAVQDTSLPGPHGYVGLTISATHAKDFRLLPCGCTFEPIPVESP